MYDILVQTIMTKWNERKNKLKWVCSNLGPTACLPNLLDRDFYDSSCERDQGASAPSWQSQTRTHGEGAHGRVAAPDVPS